MDNANPIPQALYPCKYCAEDYSWPPEDLCWSEIDQAWVCDECWTNRDSAWSGEDYINEPRGICLADEIRRKPEPEED